MDIQQIQGFHIQINAFKRRPCLKFTVLSDTPKIKFQIYHDELKYDHYRYKKHVICNLFQRHALRLLCFFKKYSIFSLSSFTVMLRKLNHFDRHFFVRICSAFWKLSDFFKDSELECTLNAFHDPLPELSRSSLNTWPPLDILSRSFLSINRMTPVVLRHDR